MKTDYCEPGPYLKIPPSLEVYKTTAMVRFSFSSRLICRKIVRARERLHCSEGKLFCRDDTY